MQGQGPLNKMRSIIKLGEQANFQMPRFCLLRGWFLTADKEQSYSRSQEETEFSIPKGISLAGYIWDGSSRLVKVLKAILGSLGISKSDSKRAS